MAESEMYRPLQRCSRRNSLDMYSRGGVSRFPTSAKALMRLEGANLANRVFLGKHGKIDHLSSRSDLFSLTRNDGGSAFKGPDPYGIGERLSGEWVSGAKGRHRFTRDVRFPTVQNGTQKGGPGAYRAKEVRWTNKSGCLVMRRPHTHRIHRNRSSFTGSMPPGRLQLVRAFNKDYSGVY